ncbi:hypothetical protein BMS3Bbin15_00762 [archaeon BMS3Bbin15]|nr:hypothetical protein BMS3Bbin15_00762 [archaeon BMS3Bbin15]
MTEKAFENAIKIDLAIGGLITANIYYHLTSSKNKNCG